MCAVAGPQQSEAKSQMQRAETDVFFVDLRSTVVCTATKTKWMSTSTYAILVHACMQVQVYKKQQQEQSTVVKVRIMRSPVIPLTSYLAK